MKSKYVNSLLAALILMLSAAAPCTAQTAKEQLPVETQKLQTIKLKVSGITCSGDCKDIQKSISKLNGVASCKQAGRPAATSSFEVTFNPAVVTEKEIRKAAEDTPGCTNPADRPYKVKQG